MGVIKRNLYDLRSFRPAKHHMAIAFGAAATIVASALFFNSIPNQTESERVGIEEEAKLAVKGFQLVHNPTHGQPLIPGDYDSAVIDLKDGSTCKVRFEHETTKYGGVPWGANVTEWGDCPLKEAD